jgi:hypothetical protein
VEENLWAKALREYWRDPANVIGPPGALVRRAIKAMWLVLSIYVLFWIAGPSQVASWQLWMSDDRLAHDLAWGFTFASALCFAVVAYAAEGTKPVRMPIPFFEFEGSLRNVKIHTTHVHIPNVRVSLGSAFAASLFLMSLLGMWNYYLHENISTGGASVAAVQGSTSRVREAEDALFNHQRQTREALAQVDAAIAQTSAGSPTGRSRLVAQRTQLMTSAAETEERLRGELREARNTTVDVQSTSADPRPVDGIVAGATGVDRGVVASFLDLMRSGVVEAMLVLGAGLGLAGGVSQLGVPKVKEEDEPLIEPEPVAENEPAPPDPEPEVPRRRFVLPEATDQDRAEAVAVGPHAPAPPPQADPENASPEPNVDADGGTPHETQPEEPDLDDPLAQAHYENQGAA